MSRRKSNTGTLVLGALGLWALVRVLEGIGDGGTAGASWTGADGNADTRDELADLPDELDVSAPRRSVKQKPKAGKRAPLMVEVTGPKVRPATPEELARHAAKKRAAATQKAPPKTGPQRPPGTVSASPELEPHHGPTLPAGYDPAKARARAPVIAAHLAARGPKAYSRSELKAWQRLAHVRADGEYGGSTRGALVFYGVPNPPRPFVPPVATLPYQPPESTP